jgi:hypothetical protein
VDTPAQVDVHQPASTTVTPTGARQSIAWAGLAGIGSDFTLERGHAIARTDVAYCPPDITFLAFQR